MAKGQANEVVGAEESKEKLELKRVFPVVAIVLIDLLGMTIIIPLMPF
jgi:hypothetical protein